MLFSRFLFIILFILNYSIGLTQNTFGISWQRAIGGTGSDYSNRMLVTNQNDIVVLGTTSSVDGDFPNRIGFVDIVISKFSATGVKKWASNFGNQFGFREAGGFCQTSDGGFIIVGWVQGNCLGIFGAIGPYDLLVIKTDSVGVLQWEKCYGGSYSETAQSIKELHDGSFLISGSTSSNDMNFSGNHGDFDAFLLKISFQGDVIWSKCFGGSSTDKSNDLKLTVDGGFIIGGWTDSDDGDMQGKHNRQDAFLAKYNADGILEWTKCFGGSNLDYFERFEQDNSGNYYAIGYSASNDGDVSGAHSLFEDIWVIKISAVGGILWQKCIGGTWWDKGTALAILNDSTIAIGGSVSSEDGDFWNDYYKHRFYISTLESNSGRLLNQAYLGGEEVLDFPYDIVRGNKSELYCVGVTRMSNPFVQNYKGGQYDIWLLKIGAFNTIKGNVYIDRNSNGQKDQEDSIYRDGVVVIKNLKTEDSSTLFSHSGEFISNVDTGEYITSFIPQKILYHSVQPPIHQSKFNGYYGVDSFTFRLLPIQGIHDLSISAWVEGFPRLGASYVIKINYKNIGTTAIAAKLRFVKDSRTSFISALPNVSSSLADTLFWDLGTLQSYASGYIFLVLNIPSPPIVTFNSILKHEVYLLSDTSEVTPEDNYQFLVHGIFAAYDPNDKKEISVNGRYSISKLAGNEFLTYKIRFQNIGNDTAFNISVKDTIHGDLAIQSFEMIEASHSYELHLEKGNILVWSFNDIKLVDSNTNEPLSHGYIIYKIKPKTSLLPGDSIKNSASIYFDFNLPVKTNLETTIIVNDSSSVCNGSSPYFVSAIKGHFYQWKMLNGLDWVNLTDNQIFSGTNKDTLRLITPNTSMAGMLFKCFVDTENGLMPSQISILRFRSTWTGSLDKTWNNTSNWSCGILPDENTDVVISSGVTNFPEISTSVKVRSLTIRRGASLLIKNGSTITVLK